MSESSELEVEPPNAEQDGRRTVLVTGICGNFGRQVARLLHRTHRVIGIDRRDFIGKPPDVEHHAVDLGSTRVQGIFRQGRIDAVIHLGVIHNPHAPGHDHHIWNVRGFQRLLEYVEQYEIPKLVFLSSTNVYGPRPDNPQLLTEEAPLLGAGPFSEIRGLVELDMFAQSFFWKRPQTESVILRPSHILGTVKNAPSNYLRLAVVPTLMGFDPMMQVVHQADVARAIGLALRPGTRGIFNLSGPPPVALSRALKVLGRRTVAVPASFARLGVERLFRWKLTSFPAPELDFIRYVCMVDDSRAKRELGYEPVHDLPSTLRSVDAERWVNAS